MVDDVALLADIGATNARFATSFNHDAPNMVQVLQCEEFDTVEAAIDDFLRSQSISQLNRICLAAAGPVRNGSIKLTNNHWVLREKELRHRYKVDYVSLLNDFESIAYSLTQLSGNQLLPLGHHSSPRQYNTNVTYIALGAGTGLGVAALVNRDDKFYPIVTEAGHANFSPINDLQIEIFKNLRKKLGHVSNEHLLSGPGIVNLYQAICDVNSKKYIFTTPAQICDAAKSGADEASMKTLHVFYEVLGQVAGDLTLTFSAFDGVYIAGGIVQRYPEMIEKSCFRDSFENKSQHRNLLKNTPTYLITEVYPGLIGAHYYASHYM